MEKELRDTLIDDLNDQLKTERLKFDIGASSMVEVDTFLTVARGILREVDTDDDNVVTYALVAAKLKLYRFQMAFNAACEAA